jgi:1-phosphatidylinositol phosphodiesterase
MKRWSMILAAMACLAVGEAQAGKGAFVRVFNLTDRQVRVNTALDGFHSEGAKESALSATIPANSAYPPSGSVYVEENTWFGGSDIIFRFSSAQGDPAIKIIFPHAKVGYRQDYRHNRGALYVYSSIYGTEADGTQYSINIFVSEQNVQPDNWMSQIRDGVNLADLLIPGTHDSATFTTILPFVATQTLDIREQLETGIRYFDLRGGLKPPDLRYYPRGYTPELPRTIRAYHGIYPLDITFPEIFDDMIRFLKRHPEEAILAQVTNETSGYDGWCSDRLKAEIERNAAFFYTENEIPTLRTARGKIVIINRLRGSNFGFNVVGWTHNPNEKRFLVQDEWNAVMSEKAGHVTRFFDRHCRPGGARDIDRLNLNFLSFSDPPKTPFQGALGWVHLTGINVDVAKFLTTYPSRTPTFQAVMLMDAVGSRGMPDGLATAAYMLNFLRYGKDGAPPAAGGVYYLRPKASAELVLAIKATSTDGLREAAARRRQAAVDAAAPSQAFILESVGGDVYRMRANDGGNPPQYLTAYLGTQSDKVGVQADAGTANPRQQWRITRFQQSDSYVLTSVVDGRVLTLEGELDANMAVDRSGDRARPDRQVWLFDRVETEP